MNMTSIEYPLLRSGGLFLLCVGLGLIAGTVFGGDNPVHQIYFFVGIGVGIATLFFARFVSFGPGTGIQYGALAFAVGLQVLLIAAAARFIGPMAEPEGLWYRTLIIVGIHFLPMAITFGPRMLVLGFFCILISTFGLLIPSAPFMLLGLSDGALKAAFGAWMLLSPRPSLSATA